jgi:quinol monooxygenase YgiN
MSYVVVAEFVTRPSEIDAFADFVREHAAASRAEPGCRVFDVCQSRADPCRFLFYEVFDDATAYAAHRNAPHYKLWLERAPGMIAPQTGGLFLSRRVLSALAPS